MGQRLDASKERRWLELVLLWQKSNLTVREFCERRQISEPSFYSWRRVLSQRGLIQASPATGPEPEPRNAMAAAKTATASAAPTPPAFVKLALDAGAEAVAPVEIVLNARRLLRVRSGFDPDLLLQLVRLLEEPPC